MRAEVNKRQWSISFISDQLSTCAKHVDSALRIVSESGTIILNGKHDLIRQQNPLILKDYRTICTVSVEHKNRLRASLDQAKHELQTITFSPVEKRIS